MTKCRLATLAAVITISTAACSHTQPRTQAPITTSAADSTTRPTADDPPRLQPSNANSAPRQTSTISPAAAILQYLQIAKSAFPTRTTSTLIRTGHTICSNLANNPSLHDIIGDLTAETGDQASAQHLVQAAITAYCATIVAR